MTSLAALQALGFTGVSANNPGLKGADPSLDDKELHKGLIPGTTNPAKAKPQAHPKAQKASAHPAKGAKPTKQTQTPPSAEEVAAKERQEKIAKKQKELKGLKAQRQKAVDISNAIKPKHKEKCLIDKDMDEARENVFSFDEPIKALEQEIEDLKKTLPSDENPKIMAGQLGTLTVQTKIQENPDEYVSKNYHRLIGLGSIPKVPETETPLQENTSRPTYREPKHSGEAAAKSAFKAEQERNKQADEAKARQDAIIAAKVKKDDEDWRQHLEDLHNGKISLPNPKGNIYREEPVVQK